MAKRWCQFQIIYIIFLYKLFGDIKADILSLVMWFHFVFDVTDPLVLINKPATKLM